MRPQLNTFGIYVSGEAFALTTDHPRAGGDPCYSLFMARPFFVYILASRKNGTLYIGLTDDLAERVRQHKAGEKSGFALWRDPPRLV